MNNNYHMIYANMFGLTVLESDSAFKFYDKDCFVSYIDKGEPGIFNYRSAHNAAWSGCKVTDLALLIINNTSAHG